jgi:hypothetical protein
MPGVSTVVIHLKRCVFQVTQCGTSCTVRIYVLLLKRILQSRSTVSYYQLGKRLINKVVVATMRVTTASLSGCFEKVQGLYLRGAFVKSSVIGMDSAPVQSSLPGSSRRIQCPIPEPGSGKPDSSWSKLRQVVSTVLCIQHCLSGNRQENSACFQLTARQY